MKATIPLLILCLVTPFSTALSQDETTSNSNTPPSSRGGGRAGGSGGFGGGGVGGLDPFRGGRGRGGVNYNVDAEFAQFAGMQLPKFDLDFPGGTPGQLVAAIEKASGKPLNAIIPSEFREMELPALKMKAVTVPQLFQALQMASARQEAMITGTRMEAGGSRVNNITFQNTSYGFRAPVTGESENPVWYFFVSRPSDLPLIEPPAKVCRFYQLAPYLEKYSIDDITTAIQTGWKMLGDAAPTMNFHKDTSLLIAVGEPEKLKLIDSALAELSGPKKADTTKAASGGANRQ